MGFSLTRAVRTFFFFTKLLSAIHSILVRIVTTHMLLFPMGNHPNLWTSNVLHYTNRMLCTSRRMNRASCKPHTVWVDEIFCGERVPVFLRLERWWVEILADGMHMQLAVTNIFNCDTLGTYKTFWKVNCTRCKKSKKMHTLRTSLMKFTY